MDEATLASITEWLEQTTSPCGNDVCIGAWAQENALMLINEVKRLRALLLSHGINPLAPILTTPNIYMRVIGEDGNEAGVSGGTEKRSALGDQLWD